MNRTLFLIAAAFLALPLLAQRHAFTIADFYRVKNVDDPQFSPDGKRVAFVVTEENLEEGKSNAELYVVDADGSNFRRLTNNPASDTHPRWSPDGSSLLFISTRRNGSQVWLLPMEGGEPRQLTDFSAGADNAEWTADGSRIVFTSDLYPECGGDNGCNKRIDNARSGGPLQAHMADGLLYRHWTTWKDGKRTHILLFDIPKGTYTDLTPGDFDSPSFSLDGGGFALSPDGKELCFVSQRDRREAETTNKDIWTVSLSGGTLLNLTADNPAYDGDPAYSPDGTYIAYRRQTVPGYESDRFTIVLFDRATRERRVVTEGFDNWVDQFKWASDSKSVFFTADVEGHVPLYRVDIATGKITKTIDAKTIASFSVAPDGRTISYVRRAIAEPSEVWAVPAAGGKPRRLTSINSEISAQTDIRPAQEMWIPSPTGSRIHTFLILPHGFDPQKKYPLILNVHGGPQSQWEDAFRGDWQMYPGAGYVVAFPNPHGSTGYGEEFTRSISGDWAGKPFVDVMAVTDSLARLPYVDRDRMGAMGWSYGGYMMMWLEGHTDRFKAIACMMGVYDLTAMHGGTEELWFPEYELGGNPWTSDLYQKWSPNRSAANFKTPCLVITGEQDYRVPYTQSLEFFTDLQTMKVPSRLIVFKNDGHWPSVAASMPFYYNAHLDWFHTYLGGSPAPYDMTRMLRNMAFSRE